jgi:hypothetical protein
MHTFTMRSSTLLCLLAAVAGTVSLTAGCGGGGSSATGATANTGGRAAVYLTDNPREEFSHVWTTIYKVELVPQSGGANVVVFDDPSGRQIDLKTLRDARGERYAFLSSANVPEGVYTGASVAIGETLQLFRAGIAVGDPLSVDASVPRDASGHPVVTATFKRPKTLGSANENIVVDFNLAKFVIRGANILPALGEGVGDGLNNIERHEKDEYHGTVSDLAGTAPKQSFTLTRRRGETVVVTTTAATALFGDTALTDGAIVDVSGTLDPATQTITATQVTTRNAATTPREEAAGNRVPRVVGTASNLNADAGTLTLTLDRAHGFAVTQSYVTVVLASGAELRDDAGTTVSTADFFAALGATPEIIVEGAYDRATNTLTATQARIVDATKDGGWARGGNHRPRGEGGKPGNEGGKPGNKEHR